MHILDVRQPAEWRHSHIRGSHNLPLTQLKLRLATLPGEKTIVTVCASGHRSNAAARRLQRAGIRASRVDRHEEARISALLKKKKEVS